MNKEATNLLKSLKPEQRAKVEAILAERGHKVEVEVTTQMLAVVGPNLSDQDKGQFHVHADGCADLTRGSLGRDIKRDPYIVSKINATSKLDVESFVYADQMDESDVAPGSWLSDFHFAPCVTV